jgi:hypothetical protein
MSGISQEAQIALAELSKRKARDRLHRDGASSIPAMQRRIRAIAAERDIPPGEIAKLMRKRIGTRDAMAFMERHHVSADWLLTGDLQGRLKMPGASSGSRSGRSSVRMTGANLSVWLGRSSRGS